MGCGRRLSTSASPAREGARLPCELPSPRGSFLRLLDRPRLHASAPPRPEGRVEYKHTDRSTEQGRHEDDRAGPPPAGYSEQRIRIASGEDPEAEAAPLQCPRSSKKTNLMKRKHE